MSRVKCYQVKIETNKGLVTFGLLNMVPWCMIEFRDGNVLNSIDNEKTAWYAVSQIVPKEMFPEFARALFLAKRPKNQKPLC